MKSFKRILTFAGALGALLATCAVSAAANKVVIGDIDDMSGPYADVLGAGGIEAIKMAIADFGGKVTGSRSRSTADHQNKADIGVRSRANGPIRRRGLTMQLGGTNSASGSSTNRPRRREKDPFFNIGAGAHTLTNKDCTPYTVHYATTPSRLPTARADDLEAGRQDVVLPHRGLCVRQAAGKEAGEVVKADGGRWSAKCASASDVGFFVVLLQAQSIGRRCSASPTPAPTRQFLKAAKEFGLTKTMKSRALLVFLTDIQQLGLDTAQGLVADRQRGIGTRRR